MKVDEDMQYSVVCSEHHRGHQNNEQKDKGAVTMEDFKYPSAPGGGLMASASTGQDDSPDAATMGGEAHHSNLTEERRSQTRERVVPGAVRMPGLNNIEGNEDDVLTVTTSDEEQGYIVTHEGTIGEISAEAELVNFDEEAKRVQDQVSQAIQRELQVAAVAEVPPKIDMRWKLAGAFLLLILIVVTVVLAIKLGSDPEPTPVPTQNVSPCGNGTVGSGLCEDASLCCSAGGYCDSTAEHCNSSTCLSGPDCSRRGAPCGNGIVGTGLCKDSSLCCSKYGYCDITAEHCDPSTCWSGPECPRYGPPCGGGIIGTGLCEDASLCCDQYGDCGSTAEHCDSATCYSSPDDSCTREAAVPVSGITLRPNLEPTLAPNVPTMQAPVAPTPAISGGIPGNNVRRASSSKHTLLTDSNPTTSLPT
jgi:hypothetical protein